MGNFFSACNDERASSPTLSTDDLVRYTWFGEALGFEELTPEGVNYKATQQQLLSRLEERSDGEAWVCGKNAGVWGWYSLAELREFACAEVKKMPAPSGFTPEYRVTNTAGDAKELHLDKSSEGALVQVASQFNCLEFSNPHKVPEDGITIYEFDHTQGPACSMCCAAACAYRNYLLPWPGPERDEEGKRLRGQTRERQLNGLSDLMKELGGDYFDIRGGYSFGDEKGLKELGAELERRGSDGRKRLRDLIRFGMHFDCEVTAAPEPIKLSQIFCSAISIAYSDLSSEDWEPLARLVLESAYEATMYATVIARSRRDTRADEPARALLTKLGAGVFGNKQEWVADAVKKGFLRATKAMAAAGPGCGLVAEVVHYRAFTAAESAVYGYLDEVQLSDPSEDECGQESHYDPTGPPRPSEM